MNKKIQAGIIVFLGGASFGLISTIVKLAYKEGFTLEHITGSQAFTGMVILWLLYGLSILIKGKSATLVKENMPSTPYWKIAIAGMFTGLVGIFYYKCVKILPASLAIILLMQYLWISMVLELIFFKKTPSTRQLALLGVVLIGTFMASGIFGSTIEMNADFWEGIGWGMLAALCYAIFLMASGSVGNELPVLKKSAIMITGSCIMTFIIFPPYFLFDGTYFEKGLWLWGLGFGGLGTVIAPLFFSIGIPVVGLSLGAILGASELPVAVLASSTILGEDVDALRWAGVFVILLGIVLSNMDSKSAAKP